MLNLEKHLNPVTLRRLRRFRAMRRAWWSLWVLAACYLLSLFSELVCNDKPLYVRCGGKSYFPVLPFTYYPDDAFTGSGKQTRPDYKAIWKSEAFHKTPGNRMVFTLFPFGPYETLNPADVQVPNEVELKITPLQHAGVLQLGKDLKIQRAEDAGYFLKAPAAALGDAFDIPPALAKALAPRFENNPSPRFETSLRRKQDGAVFTAVLPAFAPRETPPAAIRLTLRKDAFGAGATENVFFSKDMRRLRGASPLLDGMPEDKRKELLAQLGERFNRFIPSALLAFDGETCLVEFEKEDVRWPFRPVYWSHPLGIDEAGRDVLARILYGFRISMSFGLLLVLFEMVLGIVIGAVQGFFGGLVDIGMQRFIEIWSALPFLYIMILLGSVYGRGFTLLLLVYGAFHWVGLSYYMRGEFFRLRAQQFVEAARGIGVPTWKILFRHILPNALVPVITFFPFSLVGAIGSLTALDYLGFGMPPPTASWGDLLNQAQTYRWAWWLIAYPFSALFGVMLLGVFVGEGVRNALDPRDYSGVK